MHWAADNAQITGSAQLLGKISYTMGTCTLSGVPPLPPSILRSLASILIPGSI